MENKEIAFKIFECLEREHLNLYHTLSKEKIHEKINNIKNINNLTDVEFDHEMLKLFSQLKDGHTTYFIKNISVSHRFFYLNNKVYVKINERYEEVLSFNNLSAGDVVKKIKKLINYETNEWLNYKVSEFLNNGYVLEMLKLFKNNRIELSVKILDNPTLFIVSKVDAPQSKPKQPVPYGFSILDKNILYVWYKKCFSVEDYPFEKMVEDISTEIKNKNITKYILDVRNNGGGNSEVLNPFQDLIRKTKLNGVMLINNGVFSSGRFAVARFKKEFNVTLIGQGTGGAAKSYGYNKNLEVEGKRFSCSIRLWDFSDIFGYTGSITPDIFVNVTIDDYNNKNDVVLKEAIKFLSKN